MFGSKKRQPTKEELFAPMQPAPMPPTINISVPPLQIVRETEYRPCWVYGRKALFHRWANDARPQLPGGEKPGENARYYQFRATKAIVEYEDGTVGRVWPNEVQFADGGHFQEFEWIGDRVEGV